MMWRTTIAKRLIRLAGLVAISALAVVPLNSCAPFSFANGPEKTSDNSVHLAFSEQGHGRPLLLLHGLGASSYAWRFVIPSLAQKYRVIALDLKGFGRSDKPRDGKYSLFDQAELVDGFIKEHKLHHLTIVGHSFGGGVALALALKDKKRVKKRIDQLILIDSIAYKQDIPWGIALMRTPLISDLGISLIPPETQMKIALQFAYHDKSKIPPEAPREYARQLSTPGGKYALLRTAAQLIPENIERFTRRYGDLDLKTLLIWCRNDGIVPLSYGRRLYNNLPNARMHILPACVHLPQEELPELTSRLMLDFLDGR
jgi:pimeloyl-ACP methyl ester carboxylesterase